MKSVYDGELSSLNLTPMDKTNIENYRKRFIKAKGIVHLRPPEKKPTDVYVLAYSAAAHLLVRVKYLFLSTLDADKKRNAYAAYVLVRAYFETCMALGYLTIKVDKKSKSGDIERVWQIAHRILQGGKYFPTDEALKKMGRKRVTAINVYDFIDEVDKDFARIRRTKDSSKLPRIYREVYDTVLSEFGHPNHLGLQICSMLRKRKGVVYGEVNFEGSTTKRDQNNYFLYLDWGSLIFFHYWDRLNDVLKEFELELPVL